MAKKILLRVQSSEGTKRVEVDSSDSSVKLFEKVYEGFGLSNYAFTLHKDKGRKEEIISSRSRSLDEFGLRHGDTVFLSALNSGDLWNCPDPSLPSTSGTNHIKNSSSGENLASVGVSPSTSMLVRSTNSVAEDEVDLQLWKLDGKVKRKRDEKLCHHGTNACCVHCSPLEPFDESYLAEQQVKHMSFHAYLRKLTAGVDRGKFVCLEEVNCRIKPGCKGHPPWPRGICSKCQPSAVTLNRQAYRHVDNVQFENPHLVERFLNYWRTTGHQRIGFLYGRYEVHTDVPLGIRATVAVIYEPPQESTRDKVVLCPDEKEPLVDELAKQLGLRKVGWIFTDLLADDLQKGTVKHVRNVDSHFLTAQECIMAGHFQNLHPNPCRFSPSGSFGSKFVTVCVTGDSSNQVFMEGYGVSNQCTALVRHNCLVPTKDAPELGYIRESSNEQYVPDVYYKLKDSYGNEVSKLARPLPVEYLLVDVPVSTPMVPQFTFTADPSINPFPVANRMIAEHLQDFSALSRYLSQFSPENFLAAVSDFHFLLYIATMDMLPMKDFMGPLLEAIRDKNSDKAIEWSQSENWATLEQVISASGADTSMNSSFRSNNTQEPNTSTSSADIHPDPAGEAQWTCPYCTFLNLPHLVNCEMCNLPRAFHPGLFYNRQVKPSDEGVMKVLNVAEKNDAAKHIAGFLSNGTSRMREGLSKYNKLYEFDYNLLGRNCKMTMTSVSGHILNHDFVGNYRSWQKVPPISLFDAPVVRECPKDMENIKRTLEREARFCDVLVIWTDCDREGENIGFEIIEICTKVKPNIQVYRAKFSEITGPSVRRAAANLVPPDVNTSNAVEVRRELDLRIGAAFTRLQTLRLKRVFPEQLADTLISYGSCQFPTLGFVVERYKAIENFIAEQFWKIKVEHRIKDINVEFHWNRVRLFDQLFCQVLFDRCQEKPTAEVVNVREKSKSKWRPQPLDTIELEKLASRKLKINAKETMRIAERLYTQGYISYPRTETNIFPQELNLRGLVQNQTEHPSWGGFAARVLEEGPNPRQGRKSDQAHPPIHPIKFVNNLQGNEQRLYEFIVRHFLACLSKDALGMETIVHININDEVFVASGLTVLELNYLEVYPYDKWSDKEIHRYTLGQVFTPTKLEMTDGETSPPNLLTEPDLISLMEMHGIGTDATHADHIETIKSRLYVGLEDGIHFLPCHLGMGLVEGYDDMGFLLSKPNLRAELEADLKRICDGVKTPQEVLRVQIEKYREVFRIAMQQAEKIDRALAKYYNIQPVDVGPEAQQAFEVEESVMKCPSCSLDINVKKRNNGSFYLGCMGFPACRSSVWFPSNVIDVTVSPNTCPQCGPTIKQLKFKFTPGSMTPHYPNEYTGCVNGCDAHLMDMLTIRPMRANQGGGGGTAGQGTQTLRTNNQDLPRFQQPNQYNNDRFQPPPPAPPPPNRQNFRNQNEDDDNPDNVTCNCRLPAKRLVVKKESVNKGRPFFSCSKSMDERCTFFQWADENPVPQQQNGFRNNAPQNRFADRQNYNNRQGNQPGRGGGERAPRKCSNCRQEGHTLRNCPNNRN